MSCLPIFINTMEDDEQELAWEATCTESATLELNEKRQKHVERAREGESGGNKGRKKEH